MNRSFNNQSNIGTQKRLIFQIKHTTLKIFNSNFENIIISMICDLNLIFFKLIKYDRLLVRSLRPQQSKIVSVVKKGFS